MSYIQFKTPINEITLIKDVQKRISEHEQQLNWLLQVAETLKTFQGKTITKRISTAIKNNPTFSGCYINLEYIASLINLKILKGNISDSFLLGYNNNPVYDETFLLEHNNLEPRKKFLAEYKASLPLIPSLTARYNNLLADCQALVKDAAIIGLEYDFDIAHRKD